MTKTINSKHSRSVFVFALLSLFMCMSSGKASAAEELNPVVKIDNTSYTSSGTEVTLRLWMFNWKYAVLNPKQYNARFTGDVYLYIDDKEVGKLNDMWGLISGSSYTFLNDTPGTVGKSSDINLDGTNVGTAQFQDFKSGQTYPYNSNTTDKSWSTVDLKLSFNKSFSYYGHKITVKGKWQDNSSGTLVEKNVALDNDINGFVRPIYFKVQPSGDKMMFTWALQGYTTKASTEGKWIVYKHEGDNNVKVGEVAANEHSLSIEKKQYSCSNGYIMTFLPNVCKGEETVCGLTTTFTATGHKPNADDICQICGHSFFRYHTSDGNIVDIGGRDFGATVVSHEVVDGKCVIEFDAPITKIPANAFYYKNSLTGSLVIPNSVTEIGNYAFGYCTGFNGTLTLSNKLETIGSNAFSNCSSLTGDLVIPNSVTEIGEKAFYNCTGFNGTLTLSNKLETIGELAFNGCTGFTGSLKLPSSLTDIGNGAFVICKSFTSLELSNALSVIPRSAFRGCEGLSGSLVIPDGVKEIGASAFSGCTGFDGTLTLSNKLETIGVLAFGGCTGFTGSLTLPSSVTTIGESAFIRCQSFTKLELPNTLSVIPTQAFMHCRSLSGELVIPASVTEIGNHAFYDCQNLSAETRQVTLPKSLKKIGKDVFHDTDNIKTVNFQSLPEGSLGYKKKAVSLSDDSYISDQASGTVDEISYTRQMSNNWGTLVLPYSLTLTGEESYRLYAIDKMDGDELVLSRIEGTVAAGTPCVVKRNDSEADLIFGANDATLNMTIDRKIVGDMTFHGTYTTEEVNSGYVISKDCFWNVDELNSSTVVKGVKVSPFRAWLDGNAASGPARLAMRIDGSTTGINTPDALDVLNDAEVEYYDLSGKRLDEPQKGVNIVRMKSGKTKKIIIK